MTQRHESGLNIAPDHPALAGHFPGAPVVPGVVILDAVVEAAERWRGQTLRIEGVQQVKFLAPLLPGRPARVLLEIDAQALRFRVQDAQRLLAAGVLSVDAGGVS